MTQTNTLYEIHVHGDVPVRSDVMPAQIEEALRPLWRFAGAASLSEGASSFFPEEPGLTFDAKEHMLRMCWTVEGDDSFDQVAEELCQGLNEIAREGAPIEVSYFDADEDNAEDEFHLLFVGPTPQAIIRVQRDLLVEDVMDSMQRHFDAVELGGVIAEIDRLFATRMQQLEKSLSPLNSILWSGITISGLHDAGKRRLH